MSSRKRVFDPHNLSPEESALLSEANLATWTEEIRAKITGMSEMVTEGKGEEMLEFWHGPDFFLEFAGNDAEERREIAKDYTEGEDFERETKLWIDCAGADITFTLGMPEGLDLDGFDLPNPTVVAEIEYPEEKGGGGLFLVQVSAGEWYVPW